MSYDESKLSNAGKNAARAHRQLRKARDQILASVDEATEAGLSSAQIEAAFLRYCNGRAEVSDAASLFVAAIELRDKAAA